MLVKLRNVHVPTDNVRRDDLKEIQLLLGCARHWHAYMESFREAIIKEKCSDMLSVGDGFLGALLNCLEQIDMEKLEQEVQEYVQQKKRIDYLSAPKDEWFKFRYFEGMDAALDAILENEKKITVLFPNGEIAEGKVERRTLMRDGTPVMAWGVVVDEGSYEAWFDLMDLKIKRESIPELSQ